MDFADKVLTESHQVSSDLTIVLITHIKICFTFQENILVKKLLYTAVVRILDYKSAGLGLYPRLGSESTAHPGSHAFFQDGQQGTWEK